MILKNNDFSCKLIKDLHLICKIHILYVNYTEQILESLTPPYTMQLQLYCIVYGRLNISDIYTSSNISLIF